jgi:hypothetical protein
MLKKHTSSPGSKDSRARRIRWYRGGALRIDVHSERSSGYCKRIKTAQAFKWLLRLSYSQEFKSGQMTMEQFIEKAVQLRVDAVDVTGYYLNGADPSYLYSLRCGVWHEHGPDRQSKASRLPHGD